jgi:cation:H+ antiporter
VIALFLLSGFGLLLLGGEFLVRGSVGIALKLRVSKVVIGLTLVAFATSAPELIVSVIAALRGKSDIALGNVIGSNIANIGLILGVTALVFKVNRIAGAVFVALLIGYNIQKIAGARRDRNLQVGEEFDVPAMPIWKGLILLALGAIGLKFGAQFFVGGISSLALTLGLSERFVSVTLVAFGTSVPELAASLMAARKGESDIAIGNIIGSNIFNILSVLGITALITPITVQNQALVHFDFPASVLLTLIIIPLMGLFKADRLDRLEGALLLGLYVSFIACLFL